MELYLSFSIHSIVRKYLLGLITERYFNLYFFLTPDFFYLVPFNIAELNNYSLIFFTNMKGIVVVDRTRRKVSSRVSDR